jgi:ABC-2 type transport system permease protein
MNYLGTWTLFKKECWRFLKVYNQTLLAPVITSLLFLAVFNLAMNGHVAMVAGVPFDQFMASGLIIMAVVQQAFANSSSSLVMSKVIGMIIDILMPPFSAAEIIIAMIGSCIVRGVLIGIISVIAISFFIHLEVHHWWAAVYFLVMSSMLLGFLGLFAGIVSESFDHMAAITSYIITPLAFLSGTFYSIQNLPGAWKTAAHFNPFFYMIDGFRYGMTGHTDTDVILGASVILAANIVLCVFCYRLIRKGYRLKT